MSKSFLPEERLQELTAFVSSYSKQVRFNTIGHKCPANPTPFDHIKYCSQAFLSGALPNAMTLAFIAIAFDKYLRSGGSLSLDEAFGLKSIPKAGNPSKRFRTENERNGKLFEMAYQRVKDSKLSIEKAANQIADDSKPNESVTLQRYYKKNGCGKEWENAIRNLQTRGLVKII